MRYWPIPVVLAVCVALCGCRSVTSPEDRERKAAERREKAFQDMMKLPNGEDSPFGS
jgi:hypothetical protein